MSIRSDKRERKPDVKEAVRGLETNLTEDVKGRLFEGIRLTFDFVKDDPGIKDLVENQDKGLTKRGKLINLHDKKHSYRVKDFASSILKGAGFVQRDLIEDVEIAGLLHDIGNAKDRGDHAQNGAIMAQKELLRLGAKICGIGEKELNRLYSDYLKEKVSPNKKDEMKKCEKLFNQINTITYAIEVHSELEEPLDTRYLPEGCEIDGVLVSTALFMGDKCDISELRVRPNGYKDMHMKVNDCIKSSEIRVTEKLIILKISTDKDKIAKYYSEENIDAAIKPFIADLLTTDKEKFDRCAELCNEVFGKDFRVHINGRMLWMAKKEQIGKKPITWDNGKKVIFTQESNIDKFALDSI